MWTQRALLSAACLLVSVSQVLTEDPYPPPYGPPPPPGYGPSGPRFDPKELEKIVQASHRAANEKIFLKDRLAMLKAQKQELFDRLDKIENEIIPGFENVNAHQDTRLLAIKDRIKAALHRLGDLESRLAGAAAIATRNQANLPNLAARIEGLSQSNINQNAQLENISTFLNEARAKLNEKLGFAVAGASDAVITVKDATTSFADLVNTRKCEIDFTEVPINSDTGEGQVEKYFGANNTFFGNVPVVFCGVQGFVSKLNLGKNKNYGSYGQGYAYSYSYPDPRQTVAFSTDCKAFDDKILIKAFEMSRGQGNSVESVIVEYKACSFSALSGFTH